MKATRILIAQHRAIEALFDELAQETARQARGRAASQLAEELIAHMAGEEAIFYPAVRRILGDGVGMGDSPGAASSARSPTEGPSFAPHFMLRAQLRRVLATGVHERAFQPRSEALRLLFTHHVQTEETALFPQVEAALGDSQLEALGADVLGSRPPIWVVTTEGRGLLRSNHASVRGVSLPAVR